MEKLISSSLGGYLMLKSAMMGFLKDQSLGFVAFEWRI
jgi:hypothetical protein